MNAERTAIARKVPSRPARLIVERCLLTPSTELLDFGCGRGTDVAFFAEHCRTAEGYDPHFSPRPELVARKWDVVYCGFVLNVLPDDERRLAIETIAGLLHKGGRAYFAVRGYGDKSIEGTPFEDGVRTSRDTSPAELLCELVQTFTRVRRITGTAQSPFVLLEASIR